MSTIIDDSELRKKAVNYISEVLADSDKTLQAVVNDAGMRFNLSPNDSEFLLRLFHEKEGE